MYLFKSFDITAIQQVTNLAFVILPHVSSVEYERVKDINKTIKTAGYFFAAHQV